MSEKKKKALWVDEDTHAAIAVMAATKRVSIKQYLKEGKIKISKRCIHLREEIANYRWKQLKIGEEKNEYEEPIKKDDHSMDTLRYIINHIFTPIEEKQDAPARPFVDEIYGDGGEEIDDTTL